MPVSGIVLHPDLMGIRPLYDDLCQRLATHGFAVVAPEPFVRAPADVRADEEVTSRQAYAPQLDDDLQIGDLELAADYLVVHDDVREVAVVGFCMGGMQALKAAATGRFDKAVMFYGMVVPPEGWIGAEDAAPARHRGRRVPDARDLRGARRVHAPKPTSRRCAAAWADRPDCEIVVYPEAEHGFVHAPERPSHRAADAADAWRRVLAFLLPD